MRFVGSSIESRFRVARTLSIASCDVAGKQKAMLDTAKAPSQTEQ
jgi:hypothetical protein